LQEIAISQINQLVAFLRQKDVLSDDRWLVLLSFNLTQHAAVLTELEMNLHTVRAATEQSTSIGEMRQIQQALRSLQEKLENSQRFLPRPTRKRGLKYWGNYFKIAFRYGNRCRFSVSSQNHGQLTTTPRVGDAFTGQTTDLI
jgi:hypothetical protein